MGFREKFVAFENLKKWKESCHARGARVVVTNGCFDLLHLGHVTYLEKARSLGDKLLVGVNGDASVRSLKGPNRPLNPEMDRALVLAALECVDAVTIFQEVEATLFLREAKPDVYVKGGDYTLATLNVDERQAVEENCGQIAIIPAVEGKSTTKLVRQMAPDSIGPTPR